MNSNLGRLDVLLPGAAKNSSGPFLRKRESGLIGSSASKFGDRRDGLFKPMQSGAGSSAIRARAVSLRISSLVRMHLQTDFAFSPSTRPYTGQPSQALQSRPSEILSPSSLEMVSGFWRASWPEQCSHSYAKKPTFNEGTGLQKSGR